MRARRWALVSSLLWLSSPPPPVPFQKRGSQAPSGKPAAPPLQIAGRGSNILPPESRLAKHTANPASLGSSL